MERGTTTGDDTLARLAGVIEERRAADPAKSYVARLIAEYTAAPLPRSVPAWLLRLLMPYRARMLSVRMPLSNAKARAELKWQPMFPTMRDGLTKTFSQAA